MTLWRRDLRVSARSPNWKDGESRRDDDQRQPEDQGKEAAGHTCGCR